MKKYLLSLTSLLLISTSAFAANFQVTLAWNKNPEPDVYRYKVYIGTSSGQYTQNYDVTDGTTQLTLAESDTSSIYYAVVTAIDTSELESIPSNEIGFQVSSHPLPPSSPTGFHVVKIVPAP